MHNQEVPESFFHHNEAEKLRVVELTRKAIEKLESDGQSATLQAISEATRLFDDENGRGISSKTILRNLDAAELFREHSSVYKERQKRANKAKRRRSKVGADVRAAYHGLRASDLIEIVEDLKSKVAEMKEQMDKLQSQRDRAYRLRDEAMEQNTRQLAALTSLQQASTPKR